MKRRDWVGIAGSALAALAVTDRASAQASRTSEVKVEKNVTTGKGGDTELHVDIYRPPSGTEKRMALVHFHGGALPAEAAAVARADRDRAGDRRL